MQSVWPAERAISAGHVVFDLSQGHLRMVSVGIGTEPEKAPSEVRNGLVFGTPSAATGAKMCVFQLPFIRIQVALPHEVAGVLFGEIAV